MGEPLGKDSIEFGFFKAFWSFFGKYYAIGNSDEEWGAAMNEAKQIAEEYKALTDIYDYEFANQILYATLKAIEHRQRKEMRCVQGNLDLKRGV